MRKSENTEVPRAFMKLRHTGRKHEGKVKSSDQKRPPTEAVGAFCHGFLAAQSPGGRGQSCPGPSLPPLLTGRAVPRLAPLQLCLALFQTQVARSRTGGSLSLCHVGSRGGIQQGNQLGGHPRGKEMRREGGARRQGRCESPAVLFTTSPKLDRVQHGAPALCLVPHQATWTQK